MYPAPWSQSMCYFSWQGFESSADQISPRAGGHDFRETSCNLRLGEPLQEFSGSNTQGELQASVLDQEAHALTGKCGKYQTSKKSRISETTDKLTRLFELSIETFDNKIISFISGRRNCSCSSFSFPSLSWTTSISSS